MFRYSPDADGELTRQWVWRALRRWRQYQGRAIRVRWWMQQRLTLREELRRSDEWLRHVEEIERNREIEEHFPRERLVALLESYAASRRTA